MKTRKVICILLTSICFYSCNKKQQGTEIDVLGKSPIVGETVINANRDSVIVCDISLLKDTIDLPLSFLIFVFDVVILENKTEALIGEGEGGIEISNNYIGIYSQTGYKLFDRKGRYLTTLSSRGQGPKEYLISIYDSYINEDENCVYLLPMMSNNLLTYNLQGEDLKPIPLAFNIGKGRFRINNEENHVSVFTLPFNNDIPIYWEQDFDGNVLRKIASDNFIISPPDYSNELNLFQNTENTGSIDLSFFHWVPKPDTLYHYKEHMNSLSPVFTVKFKDEIIQHDYIELPNHYFIRLIHPSYQSMHPSYQYTYILIDKRTLKGSYVRLKIDALGNIPGAKWIEMNRGYYIANMYAHELKEQLSKVKINNFSSEIQNIVQQLINNIGEDDNNIILVGKLKQNINEVFKMNKLDFQQLNMKGENRFNPDEVSDPQCEGTLQTTTEVMEQSDSSNDRIYYFKDLHEMKETPILNDANQYFRNNNRYKDWDINDKREVVLEYIVEKDGTTSNIIIKKSSNNEDLDKEAVRLIKKAKHLPGTNLKGEYIRCGNTIITIYFPPK